MATKTKSAPARSRRRAPARRGKASSRLQRYRAKRNLRASGEPAGGKAVRAGRSLRFVVQKHDATRLHYDFRLEMEGVLRSWAVPKGLPEKPGDRSLAIEVEDHPLDYGGFEGVIPEGNYGAGSVMLWDRGTYRVMEGGAVEAYRAGKIHLELTGEKSRGEWTLVRFKGQESGVKSSWLLLKNRDRAPRAGRSPARDRSVLTGRTMDEILAGRSRTPRARARKAED